MVEPPKPSTEPAKWTAGLLARALGDFHHHHIRRILHNHCIQPGKHDCGAVPQMTGR